MKNPLYYFKAQAIICSANYKNYVLVCQGDNDHKIAVYGVCYDLKSCIYAVKLGLFLSGSYPFFLLMKNNGKGSTV
jgi:hypothetical protein